jgi:glycosyltransferase involved in cell wall biosynthesis
VVALSPSAKAALLSHHGLAADEVVIIPSWRSGERFRPATPESRRAARERLGIAGNAGVCVFLGALASEKRVDLALEVVGALPDVHLVLIGDGPQRATLEELSRRTLPGRAHFLGAIDDPEAVLVAADLLLVTSESEGVPGVVIEAGLCQIPTVAFDVGGVASVVIDGVTGRTVPFADVEKMASVVADVLRDPMTLGASAREHFLENHDVERVVDLWLSLLGRVVAAPQPGASAGAAR